MHLFGTPHIAWLTGIAAAAAGLSYLCRNEYVSDWIVRAILATCLSGAEIARYFRDGFSFPHHLPLNLCNVIAWVAVWACLTTSPLATEFVYFAGLTGAGMALLTPDMGSLWPANFFLSHGGVVVTAVVLVSGGIVPLRRRAMWRAFGLFAAYAAIMGIYDWRFKANFAYLRSKPNASSLMNILGPWPVYILSTAVIALFLFWLLSFSIRYDYSPRRISRGLRRSNA